MQPDIRNRYLPAEPPYVRPLTPRLPLTVALILLVPALAACDPDDDPAPRTDDRAAATDGLAPEQEAFWSRLEALCGQAFAGEMLEGPEATDWWEADLVIHVRECEEDEIRIPLHVDDDRSRTWLVSRTAVGLRLKHDHRLTDGSSDEANTMYGGDTDASGSETRQEFPADRESIDAAPGRATQHWFMEVHPDEMFAYGLEREENGLRYRIEFNLTEPVEAPPAPWGW